MVLMKDQLLYVSISLEIQAAHLHVDQLVGLIIVGSCYQSHVLMHHRCVE